jgi:hypothetical protein
LDGWIGPNYEEKHQVPAKASTMLLRLRYTRPKMVKTKVIFRIDGEPLRTEEFCQLANELVRLPVADKRGQNISLQIVSSSAFVPKHYYECDDSRVLALLLENIEFE